MPYVKIWIHAVWATKNREKILSKEIRSTIVNYIHCLFRLRNNQSISKVMQLIKGESSFWINKEKLTETKCRWQEEYFAISISESHVDKVRCYIKRQESHRSHKIFQQEYDEFITKYGFQTING